MKQSVIVLVVMLVILQVDVISFEPFYRIRGVPRLNLQHLSSLKTSNFHDLCILKSSSRDIDSKTFDEAKIDRYDGYSIIEKLLFNRFALSVAIESVSASTKVPSNYDELIGMIQNMVFDCKDDMKRANDKGKNILVRLFPSWLLPAFRVMFAYPFPQFSAWMNSWVTHWTTKWLMGPSKVYDLESTNGIILKDQGLLVEKCLFLETSGCLRTCTHACKIPTQRFFSEDMGIPVTLKPNLTDYSCRFEFGIQPLPLEVDNIFSESCLQNCPAKRFEKSCLRT